ncbi:MAG: hypothetical protein GY780_06030 [bacterium]|nr:hypothetical protein [bacterium]
MKVVKNSTVVIVILFLLVGTSASYAGSLHKQGRIRISTKKTCNKVRPSVRISSRCGTHSGGNEIHRLTRRDRRLARSLSRFTGWPAYRYLDYRSYGYSWKEISRILDIPRHIMRLAYRELGKEHRIKPKGWCLTGIR